MFSGRLLFYLKHYKWPYLLGFSTLLTASFFVMLTPVVVRRAIDAIDKGTTQGQLTTYFAIILGLCLVEGTLRFVARNTINSTSRKVEYDLRNEMAAHFMRLDQSYYIKAQTGDLMARCTNDLQHVRDLAGPATVEIGRAVTMMVVAFIFMLTIDVKLALIALAYFPLIGLIMSRFRLRVERKYREVMDQFGEVSNRVQESISGVRAIKAYAREESEIETFSASNRELMQRTMSWAIYMGAFWPLMIFAGGASIALVLWFGGREVVSGRLTIGEFVQFNTYLALLANPLMSLGWTLTMFQQGLASLRRVSEVFAAQPRIEDPLTVEQISRPRGEVEFRDVGFAYYETPVLRDINFKIPAGTTVAIVGSTGAGKTTLVNLLVRLYDPTEGQVLLDGVDLRDLALADLRELIGVVPQETFLFSDSLRENIALAKQGASDLEIEYALETSQLVNDLPQLTFGLDTVLGERGVTLSGGQKQRTALARALIKDPPVLVLDDALSHVDTHTEEEILSRLHAFMTERTTILIAHRTSTLRSADMIVALEDSRVAEIGTHAELLARRGVYARFYNRQVLAEQIEGGENPDLAGSPNGRTT